MHRFFYIFVCCIALVAMTACKEKENTITTYNEALVTSFSFAANDSFPGLAEARFTIVTSSDTGHIYCTDSLRFGTRIDSVIPRITFNHTPSYAVLYTPTDTAIYSGNDTLDFTQRPIYLYVMASDQETPKWYDIGFAVHQVDPDYYDWQCLTPAIFQLDGAESQAFLAGSTFMLFVNDGIRLQRFTSTDASTWSAPETVSGLPTACAVRQMIMHDGTFYYAEGDQLYTSTDGLTFTANSYASESFSLVSMLFAWNDSIWALASRRADDQLLFVNMAKGGTLQASSLLLPESFPVSDFGTLTFASASERQRAMIVGGYDRLGKASNMRWNIEYLPNRGYSMGDFSVEQPAYEALAGISLVWYDHAIHMFGGINADAEVNSVTQLVSTDEGLHWQMPDTTHNCLPAAYLPRQKASVITTDDHYIYIIGGQSRTATFSDVWRGRLNKTLFADYE